MRFRKKPVIIEAFQHFDNLGDITMEWPGWILDAVVNADIAEELGCTYIVTLEGRMTVSNGDWIIRGVQGELYPCKPDIFEATYEMVD